jgi:transaldolase
MPAATLRATADHGVVKGDSIRGTYGAAWDTLDELGRLGIDMADVAMSLERQGVAAFVESWNELINSVTAELKNQGAQVNSMGAVKPVNDKGTPAATPSAGLPI